MIFVMVGTHEQPFDRLIKEIDELKGMGVISDDIFIQSGFTNYSPKNCEFSKIVPYDVVKRKIEEATIVITHGGPASFIASLQAGKIPIVVPRQYEFNEHVNNHQVDFVKAVEERNRNIIGVYDINDLKDVIMNYETIIKSLNKEKESNNKSFCERFEKEIQKIIEGRDMNEYH